MAENILPMHVPTVHTDGGPWAIHDYACPVCGQDYAVLVLHSGKFQPCWSCQKDGYRTVKLPRFFLRWAERQIKGRQ